MLTRGSPSSLEKLLAFASGFLVLSLEVVLQHQLAQVTINSLFSSAFVLVLVLVALAAAAVLVPLLVRLVGDGRDVLGLALIAASILAARKLVKRSTPRPRSAVHSGSPVPSTDLDAWTTSNLHSRSSLNGLENTIQ